MQAEWEDTVCSRNVRAQNEFRERGDYNGRSDDRDRSEYEHDLQNSHGFWIAFFRRFRHAVEQARNGHVNTTTVIRINTTTVITYSIANATIITNTKIVNYIAYL